MLNMYSKRLDSMLYYKDAIFVGFVLFFVFCFVVLGCVNIKPSGSVVQSEGTITRLTQEKVMTVDGETYIIVTFPKQSTEHEGFVDNGEYVVICRLPKVGD